MVIGNLGPHKINRNGKLLLYFVDRNNLIILNNENNCEREITWQQNKP